MIVTGATKGGTGPAAGALATAKSPSLNKLVVVLVVGGIVIGMFVLAWFARRRSAE